MAYDAVPFAQAMMPTQRWSLRRAEKDQNLAYQQAQTQFAQQDQMKQQALIEQQAQVDDLIMKLPLESPDKRRLMKFRNKQRAELSRYIHENYKTPREFLLAEGPLSTQDQMSKLLASDEYLNGVANSQQVALAMEARRKGEYLVGGLDDKGAYRSGEQQMADYYAGKQDHYRFIKSYKPDTTKVYEHFGKQDNPLNKYDNNAYVPQAEVLNFLRSSNDPLIVADMQARNYIPSKVPYKRYSLQDALKFNMDMEKDRIDIAYKQQSMGLSSLRAQKLQNELSGSVDGSGRTWMDIATGGATVADKKVFTPQEGEDYTISTIGKKLSDYAANGTLEFMRIGVPNDTMQKAVKGLSGVTEGGSVPEMIFPDNGGFVLRLNQVPNRVVSVEGNIYAPPTELDAFKKGGRADGFVKARIAVSEDAAHQLGLYNTTLWDTDTKKGRGKYTRDDKTNDMIFEGYVPVRGMITNELLDLYGTKGALGGKYTTEAFSDYSINP